MRLHGERGFLELERSELGEPGTPNDEDLLLNVTVQVGGYSVADQSWVVSGDWARFLEEVRALEKRRQGRAVLEGASPDDFRLEVFSTDSAGHMAVNGHLAYKSDRHLLQLRFGFDFDPGLLPMFLQDLEHLRESSQ